MNTVKIIIQVEDRLFEELIDLDLIALGIGTNESFPNTLQSWGEPFATRVLRITNGLASGLKEEGE